MKSNLKFKALAAAALFATGISGVSQAASTSGTFDVNINLTSVCTLSAGPTNASFDYTSFGSASNITASTFSTTCTNGLVYQLGLVAGTGGSGPGTGAITPPADNVVAITYTLTLNATSGTGNAAAQGYTITPSAAAAQSGTCATTTCTNGTATNKTHTLFVTY